MFGITTIMLGIGPHSSCNCVTYLASFLSLTTYLTVIMCKLVVDVASLC